MNLGSRRIRLKAIWLLLIPFLILARPTPGLLVAGGCIASLGTAIRAWAAGCIKKQRELTTTGPYAHTRNPLYLGSLLIGIGVTVAGGRWIFTALFVLFFLLVYRQTMKNEEALLEREFGEAYRRYREEVPRLLPRLGPYRPRRASTGAPATGAGALSTEPRETAYAKVRTWFSPRRYLRNREWEAALGVAAGLTFLVIKMIWA
ncbi:MAG: methyltransferase family protein [Longimicrobiales bacterium]